VKLTVQDIHRIMVQSCVARAVAAELARRGWKTSIPTSPLQRMGYISLTVQSPGSPELHAEVHINTHRVEQPNADPSAAVTYDVIIYGEDRGRRNTVYDVDEVHQMLMQELGARVLRAAYEGGDEGE